MIWFLPYFGLLDFYGFALFGAFVGCTCSGGFFQAFRVWLAVLCLHLSVLLFCFGGRFPVALCVVNFDTSNRLFGVE